jgi:hypothetical protein
VLFIVFLRHHFDEMIDDHFKLRTCFDYLLNHKAQNFNFMKALFRCQVGTDGIQTTGQLFLYFLQKMIKNIPQPVPLLSC